MRSHIITPTNNLAASLAFYRALNFKILSEKNPTVVTDGKVIVEINTDRFIRSGVKVYHDSLDQLIEKLKELTPVIASEEICLLQDPTGTTIYLTDKPLDFSMEEVENPFSILGNFAGLSLETTDPEKTIAIWNQLGFVNQAGDISQGWLTLTNASGLSVSIMKMNTCPHLFFSPSFTYFNGSRNMEVIEKVRDAKISITEEITHFNSDGIVDNIIIRDPGGFGFFVFND